MEKVSYSLGLTIGNNLLGSGIKGVNMADFTKGIEDVLNGNKPEISYEEAKTILDQFFTELADKINRQNIEVGKAFLEKNKKEEGVVELPSGLQYKVLVEGNGRKPKANERVSCHYEGTLLDGTVFDSSYKRNQPAQFGVNQVIKGWVEALQLMGEGAKWRLFIPSDLAYGAQGAGAQIPPHATLIFDVELIKVL